MKNAEAKLLMATNRWIEDQNAKHCLFALPIFRGREGGGLPILRGRGFEVSDKRKSNKFLSRFCNIFAMVNGLHSFDTFLK
jgi:hypothetical protein